MIAATAAVTAGFKIQKFAEAIPESLLDRSGREVAPIGASIDLVARRGAGDQTSAGLRPLAGRVALRQRPVRKRQ